MKLFFVGCCSLLGCAQVVFGATTRDFLSVAKWRGTFTQSFHVSRTETVSDGCVVTARWNHDINVTAILNPLANSQFGSAWSAAFMGATGGPSDPFTGNVGIDEYMQGVCPDGTTTLEVNNGRMQGNLALQIQTVPSPTYIVSFPGITADGFINGTSAGPAGEPWIKGNISLPLPTGTNLVLDGSESFSVNSEDVALEFLLPDAVDILNGVTKTVTWHLEPAVDLEVVVDIPQYNSWIPEANLRNSAQNYEGNTLAITATLQQTDGTPSQVKPDKFHFELITVSQQPGVCMNFPPKNSALSDPDLQFNARQNDPHQFVVSNGGRVIETIPGSGVTTATTTLSAYDFGAYAVLRVTAYVGGQPIVGSLKSDSSTTDIRLPKRTSDSLVADAWKEEMGVTGAKDDDDVDEKPTGDQDDGDGFTLYEEYRGFSENLTHIRTDPHHKDLFVRDRLASSRSASGIALWRQLSGLEVHSRLAPSEIDPATRIINFNINGETPHKVDQHGLIVIAQDPSDSASRAANLPGYNGNSTPGSKQAIKILLTPNTLTFSEVTVGRAKILTDEFASTVAHEIGHGCSLYHHGENDEHRN